MKIMRAETKDGDWIIRHRIEMFRWMGFSEEDLIATEPLVREFLKGKWGDEIDIFLAVENDEVVGGCAVSYSQILPSHVNPTGKQAYLHNLYIEPEHRHKVLAIGNKVTGEIKYLEVIQTGTQPFIVQKSPPED